jgi:hypothetical protein
MASSIELQFNTNRDIILENFEAEKGRNPHFDCIVLQNVPTPQSGLELILSDWFKATICELPNVFGIVLKINGEINETLDDRPRSFDFRSKPSFLIAFESNIGNRKSMIFWKSPENDEFYSIFVHENVTSMLYDFLIQEIKAGRTGIFEIAKPFQYNN